MLTAVQVVFVVSGLGAQHVGMASSLMGVPAFRSAIGRCAQAVQATGVDLLTLVTHDGPAARAMLRAPECAFVAVVAVHIALVDTLCAVGVVPDLYLGHSIGEVACAYLDGHLSLEQTMRAAYYMGKHVHACKGAMAAVQMGRNEFRARAVPGLSLACDNSEDSITVAGSDAAVRALVADMRRLSRLATVLDTAGVPFHTPLVQPACNALRACLQQLLGTDCPPRSRRWISTSQAPGFHFSTEYLVRNLVQPVALRAALAQVPAEAVVVEIGAHDVLQQALRAGLPGARAVCAAMSRKTPTHAPLLAAIGTCYSHACVDVTNLRSLDPED